MSPQPGGTTAVGREAQLAEVEGFLDRAATGPAGLLVEGLAGIGKASATCLPRHGRTRQSIGKEFAEALPSEPSKVSAMSLPNHCRAWKR